MTDWPHAPPHRTIQPGTYMVTSGTYLKASYFCGEDRLNILTSSLMENAAKYGWRLQAWAVMSNHYHFVGIADKPENLKDFISSLHTETARIVNRIDQMTNRKVWHQYWDSHISYQTSYFARLKYVHRNPAHHKVVPVAENYPWCSAGWFAAHATASFKKTIQSFNTDKLNVIDDY